MQYDRTGKMDYSPHALFCAKLKRFSELLILKISTFWQGARWAVSKVITWEYLHSPLLTTGGYYIPVVATGGSSGTGGSSW